VDLGPGQLFRLIGVGLSNFQVEAESDSPLFEESASQVVADILASPE
jgi:DNA polymerase-4